jgi:hypothetical protein
VAINLAGLGIIFNNVSTLNQQVFQLNAVAGGLTVVYLDGTLVKPSLYTINGSQLTFAAPLAANRWVYVLSGQGGTFIPQSYVDDQLILKADQITVDAQLAAKMDKAGGNFTGPVNVQTPTGAMNPITKQMWDALPDIATPDYVDAAVATRADAAATTAALDTKVDDNTRNLPGGFPGLNGNGDVAPAQLPESVYLGSESFSKFGLLTTGAGQGRWYPRQAGILKGMLAYVEVPPEGANLLIDVRKNGTTIFPLPSNRLSIPANQNFAEISFGFSPTFARGDYITIAVDQIGSTAAGQTLTVQIEYAYTP